MSIKTFFKCSPGELKFSKLHKEQIIVATCTQHPATTCPDKQVQIYPLIIFCKSIYIKFLIIF